MSDFETAMAALFAHLENAVKLTFTADATANSAVLANVSSTSVLFAGLPVFGPGVPAGAVIDSIDANAGTVTLSAPIAADATAGTFSTGFLKTGRRVPHWNQVSEQPAMFMRRIGTADDVEGDGLVRRTIEIEIWIYSKAGEDPNAVPDVALSNLDWLVRQSLEPDDEDGRFTLGGQVYWCRIEGRSTYFPGDLGSQGISQIPIRITLP